jgi:hypothetical protein
MCLILSVQEQYKAECLALARDYYGWAANKRQGPVYRSVMLYHARLWEHRAQVFTDVPDDTA